MPARLQPRSTALTYWLQFDEKFATEPFSFHTSCSEKRPCYAGRRLFIPALQQSLHALSTRPQHFACHVDPSGIDLNLLDAHSCMRRWEPQTNALASQPKGYSMLTKSRQSLCGDRAAAANLKLANFKPGKGCLNVQVADAGGTGRDVASRAGAARRDGGADWKLDSIRGSADHSRRDHDRDGVRAARTTTSGASLECEDTSSQGCTTFAHEDNDKGSFAIVLTALEKRLPPSAYVLGQRPSLVSDRQNGRASSG